MHLVPRSARSRRTRILSAAALALASALALAACSTGGAERTGAGVTGEQSASVPSADALLADYGLDGLDARTIVDRLEAAPVAERPTGLIASVRPDVLVLSDEGREVALPMPDEFYVSIAPYRAATHDCVFHSLTTCLGELRNEEFRVVATDAATGVVVLDEARTSGDNGFLGLWLPRGTEIDVSITDAAGRSAVSSIDTAALDSATCVTSMRLG
jgi:hypothetical protein